MRQNTQLCHKASSEELEAEWYEFRVVRQAQPDDEGKGGLWDDDLNFKVLENHCSDFARKDKIKIWFSNFYSS